MSKDELDRIYNGYLGAYRVPNGSERERLLKEYVAHEVVNVLPQEEIHGLVELSKHIERFQEARPGAHFQSKMLSVHHNQFLAGLELYDSDGRLLNSAQVYGRFEGEGLLTYLIAFFN